MENELSQTKASSDEQEQKPAMEETKDLSRETEVSVTPNDDDGGRGPKDPPGPGKG